jgi:hypothetical protein
MKQIRLLLPLLAFLANEPAWARPVAIPELPELSEKADLVAIIQPVSTAKATDQLTSAGPSGGPRDPKDYVGLNTEFKVLLALKSSPALIESKGSTNGTITLLHFFFSAGPGELDGGLFAYFTFPPATLQTMASPRPNRKIAESPPTYLAFLKWNADGHFRPVTGDYDSASSFRIVTTPYEDLGMYESDKLLEKTAETNLLAQPAGTGGSAENTNRTPTTVGSRP